MKETVFSQERGSDLPKKRDFIKHDLFCSIQNLLYRQLESTFKISSKMDVGARLSQNVI